MADALVKFENNGVEGLVAVGTTLGDAAKRLGVRLEADCGVGHDCIVKVASGNEFLSPLNDLETEHFANGRRSSNERLACEARIIKSGELTVMTETKQETTGKTKDSFQAEFQALPLDKKITTLFQMEAVTLGETFNYVADSTMKALGKLGDTLSDIGSKIETEAKKATQASPAEPKAKAEKPDEKAKPKSRSKKSSDETPEAGGI